MKLVVGHCYTIPKEQRTNRISEELAGKSVILLNYDHVFASVRRLDKPLEERAVVRIKHLALLPDMDNAYYALLLEED